jgi:hypothetical protein
MSIFSDDPLSLIFLEPEKMRTRGGKSPVETEWSVIKDKHPCLENAMEKLRGVFGASDRIKDSIERDWPVRFALAPPPGCP